MIKTKLIMKPDPDTILSQARGELSREILIGEKTGFFSKQLVSGKSVYSRLRADEKLHYLLVNTSDGLTITSQSGTVTEELTPTSDYYAVTAITDQRVFFLIGRENEDTFRNLEAPDITAATLASSLLTTKAVFGTKTERYEFPVKKRASSDPSDAVSFVVESLVGMTSPVITESTDKARQGKTPTGSDPDSRRSASDGGVPIEQSPADPDEQTQTSAPGTVFIADEEVVSEDSKWLLDRATTTIGQVNASEDNLNEAINELRRAKNDLQDVVTKPGVDTETVETAIERIDLRLNPLESIRSARAKADRKLLLADKGIHVSEKTFEDIFSTLEDAIETANELDRPHEKLLEQRDQILDNLGHSPSNEADQDAGHDSDAARENRSEEDTEAGVSTSESEAPHSPDPDDVSNVDKEAPESGVETDDKESTPESEATSDKPEDTTDSNTSTGEEDKMSSSTEDPSRADLIGDLERIQDELGKQPTPIYIKTHSEYSREQFFNEFGGYMESIEAAFGEKERWMGGDSPEVSDEGENGEPEPDEETEESLDGETERAGQPELIESATREDIVSAIEELDANTEGALTTSEFTVNTPYSYSDIYDHFGSWSDAVDEARTDSTSADALLKELHRLEAELGYIPRTTDVEQHSKFAPYDYQAEFGGYYDALDAAGLDLNQQVNDTIRQVAEESDGKPSLSDFEAASPYSSTVVYRFYDGWDEAIAAATADEGETNDTTGESGTEPTVETEIRQNELSEQYELLRNLRYLCSTVLDVTAEVFGEEQTKSDPMTEWFEAVDAFWKGESTDSIGFGAQQNEKNGFTMEDYREPFGNGNRVTQFDVAPATRLPLVLQALLHDHVSGDIADYFVPVDSTSDTQLPVFVGSKDELDRAVEMLERLPVEPTAVQTPDTSEKDGTGGVTQAGTETTTATEPQGLELRDVNAISDSIAQSLIEHGYNSRSDLKAATMDELSEIDQVSSQIAMRIKLDVGE